MQFLYNIFRDIITWIDGPIQNYAWSIIIMTVLLRLIMLPMDLNSKKTSLKQQAIQPKLEALQKKYKNDKDKFAQKQMELYKQEKINPLSGCLPLLITLPIFFAFFGALRMIAADHLAELYIAMQDPPEDLGSLVQGWLWVQNIWQPDAFPIRNLLANNVIPTMNDALIKQYAKISVAFAEANITTESFNTTMKPLVDYFASHRMGWNGFYILPVLAGATSLLHSKITFANQPAPTSPDQQNNPLSGKFMKYLFPIMSVYFCATSNAVFAIYWFTSNVIAIGTHFLTDKIVKTQLAKQEAAKTAKNGGNEII